MAAATAAAGAAAGASTPLIAHGFGANPGMDPPVPPDAAPSILLSAVYFAAVTLPAQLVRFAALLLRLAFSLILFLGTLLSPLASLLSHALMPLLGLVSPRHISLSLSFDLAWLVRWATYASLATAIFYTWRYVWGGRYSRLPPTDPKVLKFQPDKLAPGSKPEAAPAEAEDSDLEDDPEHQLRALADLLSGIKVFKYLDPRVFFELLKSFSTRTVEAGETIIPEGRDGAEGDLIVVINGEVELFLSDPTENVDPASTGWATPNPGFGTLRKSRTTESALGAADPFPDALAGPEEAPRTGRERRTLLKLVRRGGTVTSLLGILAVFASEAEEPLAGLGVEDFETQIPLASPDPVPRANGHVPEGDQPDGRSPPQAPGRFPTPSHPPSPPSAATPPPAVAIKRLLPNLSAVAKTPAALAVLPASAFLRMSPEAKQSLVHVILARFSRSAGRVMRGYLGLEEGAWGVVRALNHTPSFGPLSLPYTLVDRLRACHSKNTANASCSLLVSLGKVPTPPSPGKRALFDVSADGEDGDDPSPVSPQAAAVAADDLNRVRHAAWDALLTVLGSPPSAPPEGIQLLSFSPSAVLLKQGRQPAGLYFVVDGAFTVTSTGREPHGSYGRPEEAAVWDPLRQYAKTNQGERHISFLDKPLARDEVDPADEKRDVLGTAAAGAVLGYVPAMTGYPSFATARAAVPSIVARFPLSACQKLLSSHPRVLAWLSGRLLSRLPPLSLHVDLAMEWLQPRASQVVVRQGDLPGRVFVVLQGRLRSIREQEPGSEAQERSRSSGTEWATLLDSDGGIGDEDANAFGFGGLSKLVFANLGSSFLPRRRRKAQVDHPSERKVSFEILGEHAPGESIGEVEVVMDRPFPATVHAIRDSEVAAVPATLFSALARNNPEIMVQLGRVIAGGATKAGDQGAETDPSLRSVPDRGMLGGANLKTVAIIPVNSLVPVQEFAERLRDALQIEGASAAVLNTAAVLSVLGKHAFTRLGKLKLMNWLAEQEETSRLVLYVADGQPRAPWTQRCIRQADAVLVVGLGDEEPAGLEDRPRPEGDFEELLKLTTARKDLVLLHNERHVIQGSTAKWLRTRNWVNAHHHVQMHVPHRNSFSRNAHGSTIFDGVTRLLRPSSIVNPIRTVPARPTFARLKSFDHLEPSLLAAAAQTDVQANQITADFRRLARRMLAKTIGLVLGGGGARGLAHVGMIKALEEAGIEFDMIGGTSQGAFIGGILAREGNSVAVIARSKSFASRMSSTVSYLMDVTYPGVAYFTGHEFNRTVWKTFSDSHIEDTWIPFFCTAVNVTWSRLDIERSGYLWRSVRASMSLMGLVPPMNSNGDMLVDGGYINNLPADVARSLGAAKIIAVDVGGVDDTSPVSFGDHISGWTYLWDRWNPFKDKRYQRIPSMTELQSRVAYVSQVQQLEEVKRMDGVFYLHPPTAKYGILEFGKGEDIVALGYDFGRSIIKKWREDGTLASFGIVDGRPYPRHRRASHGVPPTSSGSVVATPSGTRSSAAKLSRGSTVPVAMEGTGTSEAGRSATPTADRGEGDEDGEARMGSSDSFSRSRRYSL